MIQLNYPNGIKKNTQIKNSFLKKESYKNRGMTLENELNSSNEYYIILDQTNVWKSTTLYAVLRVIQNRKQICI